MKVLAPAKINLFLSVGGRREDGFHRIASLMQAVSLFDELDVDRDDVFTLDVAPAGSAPEDDTNLVVRAARALWASLGRTPGATLRLTKSIPVGAGLAGGSADAAAALVGLNELWDGRLSRKALGKIGASIGADVPFCVAGGTCAVRGAGEVVTPMPVRRPLWWAIAVPPQRLSTAAVYQELDRAGGPEEPEDPFELADALARGDLGAIAAGLRNDLTDAACSLEPSVGTTLEALRSAGATGVIMSGSGTACAGLCSDEEHARGVAAAAGGVVATSLTHGPKIQQ